jgi:hypothetical protein
MKRLFCMLLALCLFVCPALAEYDDAYEDEYDGDDGWVYFESRFGFSAWYLEYEISQWEDIWNGQTAEFFCPVEDQSGNAFMVFAGHRFSMLLWDDYSRIPLEPSISLDYPCEVTAFTDGGVVLEQWIVSVADGDYVFILQYEADDPCNWRQLFYSVLGSVEFPSQPVQNVDFLLDYFQGGAAGMQFIDVVYDEEADPITLVPYREMQDFVLEVLTWDDEAFTVKEAFSLYAASPLSPGDNLNIYCYFADILPVLRMRYTDAEGEAQCWYITQSGRDGSLMLLAEDEV